MRIDGLGSPGILPLLPGGSSAAQTQPANNNAMLLAIQQEEKKGGGSGGGGHAAHGAKKTAMDSIDEIAARASLNIESRKKTMADRMREIEQMKAEMAESEDTGEDASAEDNGEQRRDSETSG